MKSILKLIVLSCTVFSTGAFAATGTALGPNFAGKTLTIPSGGGADGGVGFIGFGGTDPAPFANDADGVIVAGFGVGDARKLVGFQAALILNDVSRSGESAGALKIHRKFGNRTSVAIGGENLFHDSTSDSGESYYISMTHNLARYAIRGTNMSKVSVTFGAGDGRFSDLSQADVAAGNGKDGTTVFAGVSYALEPRVNLVADWNGANLSAGIAFMPFKSVPSAFTFGLTDLTNNSGDEVRIIGSFGLAWDFYKR